MAPELFYIGEWSPRSEPVLRKIIAAHPQPAGVKSTKKPSSATTREKKSAVLNGKALQMQTSCQTGSLRADWQGWPGWHNAGLRDVHMPVYASDDVYARWMMYGDRACSSSVAWGCSWNAAWDGPWDGAGWCEFEWSSHRGDAFVDYRMQAEGVNVSHPEPMSPQDEAFMAEMAASVAAFLQPQDDSSDCDFRF